MKHKRFSILFFIGLITLSLSCQKKTANIITPMTPSVKRVFYTPDKFVMGSDLSYVNQLDDYGATFQDSGKVKDAFQLFKDRGNNLVRVRLWHNPTWTAGINNGKMYSDIQDVAKTIKRAKAAGMTVNLDLHYSDTWADPQRQDIPKAWEGLPLSTMKDSVYNYTLNILKYLQKLNLTPEMIQIGNENNNGTLWPVAKITNNNFQPFADIVNSGIKAVRDFSVNSTIKPQVIIHVAQLQDAEWWADGVINKGGVKDFDIIGLSHYYKWSTVNDMTNITNVIKKLKTQYGKKVMIVEAAFSWTSADADTYGNIMTTNAPVGKYAISQDGQAQYMRDLVQAVIDGGGTGIMYWEPAWITSKMKDLWGSGSSWDNNTLFDFSGKALPAFEYMTYPYNF